METVHLGLGERSYSIHIGENLLGSAELVRSGIAGRQVFIVTNTSIAPLYLEPLLKSLDGLDVDWITVADGEKFKTLSTFEKIISALLEKRHTRDTTLIALGGGVIGDITGFAAACYLRGVPYLQIPTTLLSQVDSSVGGKTAVNHALGKNMIGAFHQPRAVYIDINTLHSLPHREMVAGTAEVIKHGAIADSAFFGWLEENLTPLLALDPAALIHTIKKNCEIKSSVVESDEKEKGRRALLNFGHTFGHAIENSLGYGEWLHGEAVAAGMVMAADLSCRLQLLDYGTGQRLRDLIAKAGLPVAPPEKLNSERLMDAMQIDKKADDSGVRFVLLKALGEAELITQVPEDKLQETLSSVNSLCQPAVPS